ncbi:Uncharacterised protein [Mycobacteroides abscessus subsp. abscessus]|nr:Uncharacterised protein [Mycobacteroides abscessus subsp. abscessus]
MQVASDGLDFAHARQEYEDRTIGGCDRVLDRARHVRQVLAAHTHALVPDRAHGLDAARRGSVAQLQRENIARNINERGLLARRGAQEINRARGLKRRRRECDEKVIAQRRAGIQRECQRQVSVQVALVELIDDQGGYPGQLRVALQAAQRHARRHHLHARAFADARIPAHRIADLPADLLAEQTGDPAGRSPRGHPARLRDENPAARARFRKYDRDSRRKQRRLTRTRGCRDDRAAARPRRRRDIAQGARDRQLRRV